MSVCIGTPVLGRPESAFSESLGLTLATFGCNGVAFDRVVIENDSLVHRARNAIAHRFLRGTCSHLLMVDADMSFAPSDVLALMAAGVDVVGGVCARKVLGSGPVIHPLDGGESRDDGLIEVSRIGTGFLLVSREAMERLADAFPADTYTARPGDGAGASETVHAFFQSPVIGGELVSEDFFFCDRWRSIGGRVWAHAGVRPGHVGSHVFEVR